MPDSNALLVGYRSCFYPVGLQVITAAVFSLIFIMAFLGRQFGFNLDFLNVTASPGIVKFWQVSFLLGGMGLSYLFLNILEGKHQEEKTDSLLFSRLKWLPIMLWGA